MPGSLRDLRPRVAALVVLGALLVAPLAAARDLSWRELAVSARLAGDGTLTVSERHAMVFTGDWNGGERKFRLPSGQRLELEGLFRRDGAGGDWRALESGSLDEVDRWKWADWETLRWRSRLPGDPEFSATEIGYRIDYSLRGVLRKRGGVFVLDHDFAFPEREGSIERFVLDLELAPEWRLAGRDAAPLHFEAGPLPPGTSFVVARELEYRGAEAPAHATPRVLPDDVRLPLLLLAVIGNVALLAWAVRRERAIGRFGALPPVDSVERGWIERHVLGLPPEEVGAAWDRSVGAAEVTALLARLQQQGKISSRVEETGKWIFRSTVLHLQLLVPRDSLSAVERPLVDGLFPSGDTTDTAALRAHYRSTGFDPAGRIRAPLERLLDRRPGLSGKRPHPPRRPSVLLILGGLVLAGGGFLLSLPGISFGVFALPFLLIPWLVAFLGAFGLRGRLAGFGGGPAVVIALAQIVSLLILTAISARPELSWLSLVGAVLFQAGLTRTVATALQSRESAEAIARRRELLQARRWLERELKRKEPRLDDAWLPYLIAFGLAPEMDRWFRQFGGAVRSTSAFGSGSASGGGTSLGGGGWSGGGGTFGGAGATASWAAAATGLAAGVSKPSSSGGSGGGGGGGGSSGGGGGGGW